MLITWIYIVLSFFARELFNSLVYDPDRQSVSANKQGEQLDEEFIRILGVEGQAGFKLKLVKFSNRLSDMMLVVSGLTIFSPKTFESGSRFAL